MPRRTVALLFLTLPPACLCLLAAAAAPLTPLPLPGGQGGIGFDDLVYSRALDRVLVPAGRTGRLDLVDPKTLKVEAIGGFTSAGRVAGGHGQGTTSADSGRGLIFASDRDRRMVVLVDPRAKKILRGIELGGSPDYVRWVEPNREVWVTEPNGKVIEYFKLETEGAPRLVRAGTIGVKGGPESLVVDASRGRAYTHTWHDVTIAIDLKAHKEVARWPNGCEGARGIALDEERGLLFVGCEEGKAVVLDVAHDGKRVGLAATGKGVDIIAYSARLKHLYVPGGDSGTMTVLSVAASGALSLLDTVPTAAGSHCVAADQLGDAYVCDPANGRLLVYTDKSGS
jgi:hypothetical protein